MRQVTKEEWIDALWSGEYRQTQGQLHSPESDSYCCLGVLADVAGVAWSRHGTDDGLLGMSDTYLPERMCRAIGMEWLTKDVHMQHVLASRNDNGASFREIGEYLKELPW